MVLRFYQNGRLFQKARPGTHGHVHASRLEDIQRATIVHLILQVEQPFKTTEVVTYNFWKEGDGG